MAGAVIRVVPKTFVSFSNIPGQGSGPTVFWLARKVDVMPWTELTAIVRLHPGSSITGGTFLTVPTVIVYADGYTDEDPSVFPGFTTSLTSVTLGSSLTGPTMFMTRIPASGNAGCCLAFAIAAQVNAAGTSDLYLSIDVSGKALRGPNGNSGMRR